MIRSPETILQIFGSLMKSPRYLSEIDKYSLSPIDFNSIFEKSIFIAINNLYQNGAQRITPVDIDNFLVSNLSAKQIFDSNNGIEYLQDAEDLSEETNFPYYYKKLKKINLLNDLSKKGIDISDIYIEDPLNPLAYEINKKFEELSIDDILSHIKKKFLTIEKDYRGNETVQEWELSDVLGETISTLASPDNVGLSINGDISSYVLNGAYPGTLTIRSLPSGNGKSRLAIGDACKMAYPFYYDWNQCKWIKNGHGKHTLFIMTEQSKDESVRMILAYLTGINEDKLKFGPLNDLEYKIIHQAEELVQHYKTLHLLRIPDPSIELIKMEIREQVLLHDIHYVFYDYIFISNALLNEYRGTGLRNDELLLLMATALKDIAVEQDVALFTSTQVNAKADDNTDIKNEGSLAGGRATINKADNGLIGSRVTNDELQIFRNENRLNGMIEPNRVFDIFKVRGGRWTQLKIWSYFDMGTLRLKDLFVTDARLCEIPNFEPRIYDWTIGTEDLKFLDSLNRKE